jgi:formylglycine-generating enzyme required for sulfatase activity
VRDPDGNLKLREETGMVFVLIPGGTFMIGAEPPTPEKPSGMPNVDPQARPSESPVRPVKVPPFFISKYEMTQGQWARFTGENPSLISPESKLIERNESLLHPVGNVNCTEFERILGRLDFRLPTDAEWEYAARAGTTTIWWTGDEQESLVGAANVRDLAYGKAKGAKNVYIEAWLDDGYAFHAPVGSFRPNPFGLHDVCGNMYEWCYHRSYTRAPLNDNLPYYLNMVYQGKHLRVVRGGSYDAGVRTCRSSYRNRQELSFLGRDLGVRPAFYPKQRGQE